jgi:hypothetical protein
MSRESEANGGLQVNLVIVEAIAQRVAELLRADLGLSPRLLTPSQVAERFAVSRTWVYEHADELGAVRLGQGPKARLRFGAEIVSQALHRNASTCSEGAKTDELSSATEAASQPALLPIYGALGGR